MAAAPGDEQRETTAERGEERALREHLGEQPKARRAQRASDRHLLVARLAADEQQIGNVGAGDQQHEADGAEQREEVGTSASDQIVAEGGDVRRERLARVVEIWKLAHESLRQEV